MFLLTDFSDSYEAFTSTGTSSEGAKAEQGIQSAIGRGDIQESGEDA